FALAYSYIFMNGFDYFGIALFIIAIFVALGRVLAGAHFIVDVVAGSLIAFLVCLLVYTLNISFSFGL
ncbi:phosphatase PAP2 family protein, partial [Patescibacteria group bacterium]|nr:phosphatase PAP2 family protein [Patescibacteria group bacterium]